jgi:hypothetical protein
MRPPDLTGVTRRSCGAVLLALTLAVLPRAAEAEQPALPDIHGFVEAAFGPRFGSNNANHRQFDLAEARLQLETEYFFTGDNILAEWMTSVSAKGDLLLDLYYGGKVITDLRELYVLTTPLDFLDLKGGRQVLTWGTGDLIFLNDLFPKDYVSFFAGRDDEYLKLPNDALRAFLYSDIVNLDLVWIPFFRPDEYPRGNRLTFYDPFRMAISGKRSEIDVVEPSRKARNFVYAARAYRNIRNYEIALYYYRGFDPAPSSFKNERGRQIYHQRLDAYGASVRGPLLWGIFNAEWSYHYSPEDPEGDIRTIMNSEMEYLAGYEKDLGHDLRVSFQYYLEQKLDYEEYKRALLPADRKDPRFTHTITNRITKLLANQTVKLSFFTFFSPSDLDVYHRPVLSWDATDEWNLTVGANLFWGADPWTRFGEAVENKNVYARLRYSF